MFRLLESQRELVGAVCKDSESMNFQNCKKFEYSHQGELVNEDEFAAWSQIQGKTDAELRKAIDQLIL